MEDGLKRRRAFTASRSILKFGVDIVTAARGRPIVDVACGGGRNSAWLSHLGGKVIALDVDLHAIARSRSEDMGLDFAAALTRVSLLEIDLVKDAWPFTPNSLGGIVNIHFLHLPLLAAFAESLGMEGRLMLETVEDRGENHRELPPHGEVRRRLGSSLKFIHYLERPVKRENVDAVTVRLFALRK